MGECLMNGKAKREGPSDSEWDGGSWFRSGNVLDTNSMLPSKPLPPPSNKLGTISSLTPILACLSLSGCYPSIYGRPRKAFIILIPMIIWSLALLSLNGWIFLKSCFHIKTYIELFKVLHAYTVCAIILVIKPLINIGNISVFLLNFNKHSKMLKKLEEMDKLMRSHGILVPQIGRWNLVAVGSAVGVTIFNIAFRIVELCYEDRDYWDLPLTGMISFWNITPLCYFLLIQSIVSHWAKVSDMFGPWILVNMIWGVFTLCLTIYFLTQAPTSSSFSLENHSGVSDTRIEIVDKELETAVITLKFMFVWSFFQILVTILYIAGIGSAGISVNEETRKIVSTVLEVAQPRDVRVSRFVYKSSTQYYWGVTVWRAFPVERGLFFTIVSIIVTYAVLLLRLRTYQTLDPACHNGTYPSGNFSGNIFDGTVSEL